MGGIRGSRFPRGVDLRVCTRLAACPCERLKVRAAAAVAPRARARDEEQRRLRTERRASQGTGSAVHLCSLSARIDVAGDEGSSESEGSGQASESSEDETITDPALLFPILEMSERLRLSANNLSKGLQSNGNGKLWKKGVSPRQWLVSPGGWSGW